MHEVAGAERPAYRRVGVPSEDCSRSFNPCDWLLRTRVDAADGGGTAKAIDYSLKRWSALRRYARDGRLPIADNPA